MNTSVSRHPQADRSARTPTRVRFEVTVEGIAWWSDRLPDWPHAAAGLRGERAPLTENARRPATLLLPPAERRRAPDSVAMGLEVAARAMTMSGRDPLDTPSVFASAFGDLAIADAMCTTLADDPSGLSPVKFHHSVHNAVSGYWGIATGSHQPSTSISAYDRSFAVALLEAVSQGEAQRTPVLLVAYDVQTVGVLGQLAHSDGRLAVALVLAPTSKAREGARLDIELSNSAAPASEVRSVVGRTLRGNAMADAITLFELLAHSSLGAHDVAGARASDCLAAAARVRLPVGDATHLTAWLAD